MKTFTIALAVSIGLYVLLLGSCTKKNELGTPTFIPKDDRGYCKIDGKNWETCTKFLSGQEVVAHFYPGSKLQVEFNNVCEDHESYVYFELKNITDTGVYLLSNYHFGCYYIDAGYILSSRTDSTHTGTVHITKFDKTLQRLSGTFEMILNDTVHKSTIYISEGQFTNARYERP